MTGAGEELLVGLPCGVLPAGLTEQELEAMPEGFMVNPHKRLEIGDRYTNDQVSLTAPIQQPLVCISWSPPVLWSAAHYKHVLRLVGNQKSSNLPVQDLTFLSGKPVLQVPVPETPHMAWRVCSIFI